MGVGEWCVMMCMQVMGHMMGTYILPMHYKYSRHDGNSNVADLIVVCLCGGVRLSSYLVPIIIALQLNTTTTIEERKHAILQ
jgi:hypothetical protein